MSDDMKPGKDPHEEWDDHVDEIDGTSRYYKVKVVDFQRKVAFLRKWAEDHSDKTPFAPIAEPEKTPKPKVELPPGSTMLEWANFVFPKKFVDRMLTNEVRDMCLDYFDALDNDRPLKRKWVLVRGHLWCVICIFAGLAAVFYDKIVSSIKKMKF